MKKELTLEDLKKLPKEKESLTGPTRRRVATVHWMNSLKIQIYPKINTNNMLVIIETLVI